MVPCRDAVYFCPHTGPVAGSSTRFRVAGYPFPDQNRAVLLFRDGYLSVPGFPPVVITSGDKLSLEPVCTGACEVSGKRQP